MHRSLFLLLLAALGTSTTQAQTSMTLTANIQSTCTILSTAPSVAWSVDNSAALQAGMLNLTHNFLVQVRCATGSTGVRLEFDGGQHWDSGLRYRFMRHATNTSMRVPYSVEIGMSGGTNGAYSPTSGLMVPSSLGTVSSYYGTTGHPSVGLTFSLGNTDVNVPIQVGVHGHSWLSNRLNPNEMTPLPTSGTYTDTLGLTLFF